MTVSTEVRMLVDAFEDPHVLIRPDYTVAYANKAFVRRYGRSDYAGRTCHELVFHRASRCSECGDVCPLERASVSGQPVNALRQVLTPGGVLFYELESKPIRAMDGKTVYYLELIRDKSGTKELLQTEGVVAKSPAVRRLLEQIARVVSRDTPVLFTGELGTGKGVFARLIHENSRRAAHSFLHLDCATLDEQVLSEEFSHAVGSDLAGGTVYLSDVAELTPEMQYVILRLLETGCYAPRGRSSMRVADLRVLAATSRDLAAMVREGRFREDLFYRLSTCRFRVPALRERQEDVVELAGLLLSKLPGGKNKTLTGAAREKLVSRYWAGNSYELEAALERALIFSKGPEIGPEWFEVREGDSIGEPEADDDAGERVLIHKIRTWKGTRAELARELGVSVRTLYRIIKRHEDELA